MSPRIFLEKCRGTAVGSALAALAIKTHERLEGGRSFERILREIKWWRKQIHVIEIDRGLEPGSLMPLIHIGDEPSEAPLAANVVRDPAAPDATVRNAGPERKDGTG